MSKKDDLRLNELSSHIEKRENFIVFQLEEAAVAMICEVFQLDDIEDLSLEQKQRLVTYVNGEVNGAMKIGFEFILSAGATTRCLVVIKNRRRRRITGWYWFVAEFKGLALHFEGLNLRVDCFSLAAGVAVPLPDVFRSVPFWFSDNGLDHRPYGLARFDDDIPFLKYFVIGEIEGVQALAELGVVFLLFLIGLELSWSRLWALRRMVFGLGGSQVVITGTVIALFAYMFGNSAEAAVILGAGLALSSTAIVMQLLIERDRLGTSRVKPVFRSFYFKIWLFCRYFF